MCLLTTYKESLLQRHKKSRAEAKQFKESIKEKLFNNLVFSDDSLLVHSRDPNDRFEQRRRHVVYYLCGYLIKTRKKIIVKCPTCRESMETEKDLVPHHFDATVLVDLKTNGGLKYCTEQMFHTFYAIEKNLEPLLKDDSVFIRESFDKVVDSLSTDSEVPLTCCNEHRSELLPRLILDYIIMRYRFEAKRRRREEKSKIKAHDLKKMSRHQK